MKNPFSPKVVFKPHFEICKTCRKHVRIALRGEIPRITTKDYYSMHEVWEGIRNLPQG